MPLPPPPSHMGAHPMFPPGLSPALFPPLRGTWELIPCPPWLRREELIFAPPSSPLSHGSSSHVPPWVISRSLPPVKGDMGAHPMSLPLIGNMGARPMSPGVDPMPLPLVGDMGAHPMSPVRERNTLCVPLPKKGEGDGGCPRFPPLSSC